VVETKAARWYTYIGIPKITTLVYFVRPLLCASDLICMVCVLKKRNKDIGFKIFKRYILEGLGMEHFGIFYGHLVFL
jgi:hypothetical protein